MKRSLMTLVSVAAAAVTTLLPAAPAHAATPFAIVDTSIIGGGPSSIVHLTPGIYMATATGTYKYLTRGTTDYFADAECSQKVADPQYRDVIDNLGAVLGIPLSAWHRDSYGATHIESLDGNRGDVLDLDVFGQDQVWIPNTPTLFSGGSNPYDGNGNLEILCNTNPWDQHAYTTLLIMTKEQDVQFAVHDADAGAYLDNAGVLTVKVSAIVA
jgi:hypothetical protein